MIYRFLENLGLSKALLLFLRSAKVCYCFLFLLPLRWCNFHADMEILRMNWDFEGGSNQHCLFAYHWHWTQALYRKEAGYSDQPHQEWIFYHQGHFSWDLSYWTHSLNYFETAQLKTHVKEYLSIMLTAIVLLRTACRSPFAHQILQWMNWLILYQYLHPWNDWDLRIWIWTLLWP